MSLNRKFSFHYCFYQIRCGNHVNYHHVLISTELVKENDEYLKRLECDGYAYYLQSIVPVLLTESETRSDINRPLLMDGESLWKRLKKNRSLNT